MDTPKTEPRCGHISQLAFTTIGQGGAVQASRPLRCDAPATHLIRRDTRIEDPDGMERCADHLAAALTGQPGAAWCIVRLDAETKSADEALTAAGAQVALDRLQEHHATLAERVELIAGQRDRLVEAFRWLEEDPSRIATVLADIEKVRASIEEEHARRSAWGNHGSREQYVAMRLPTLRSAVAEAMAQPLPNIAPLGYVVIS